MSTSTLTGRKVVKYGDRRLGTVTVEGRTWAATAWLDDGTDRPLGNFPKLAEAVSAVVVAARL